MKTRNMRMHREDRRKSAAVREGTTKKTSKFGVAWDSEVRGSYKAAKVLAKTVEVDGTHDVKIFALSNGTFKVKTREKAAEGLVKDESLEKVPERKVRKKTEKKKSRDEVK